MRWLLPGASRPASLPCASLHSAARHEGRNGKEVATLPRRRLLVVYWLSVRLSLAATLGCATLAWIASAAVILVMWSRVYPSGA
jgi:hypothetical protein